VCIEIHYQGTNDTRLKHEEDQMSKLASFKDIIERVNEKGESPQDVSASYGISKDTLRRRMKEGGDFVIDNSTKKYHKDGKLAIASDYEGMEFELIKGKGNTLKKHMGNTPEARQRDTQVTHADNTKTHVRHGQDTKNTPPKHEGGHSRKSAFTFDDFTSDDGKKLRTILDAWDGLQERLAAHEIAAAFTEEIVPLQERRMQLDTEDNRTRRAYTISNEVWKKFDEITDGSRIQKGEALEIALIDFFEKYQ
jgi:hypothetical protein